MSFRLSARANVGMRRAHRAVSQEGEGERSIVIVAMQCAQVRGRGHPAARTHPLLSLSSGNRCPTPLSPKILFPLTTFTLCPLPLPHILPQASESVFVDLLTYQDLEVLKTRQAPAAAQQLQRPTLPPSNKRYLILTYAGERGGGVSEAQGCGGVGGGGQRGSAKQGCCLV